MLAGVGLNPHAVVAGETGEDLHPSGKTPGPSDYAPGEKQWMLERLGLRGCRLQGVLAEAGRGRPCMGDSAGQPEESCKGAVAILAISACGTAASKAGFKFLLTAPEYIGNVPWVFGGCVGLSQVSFAGPSAGISFRSAEAGRSSRTTRPS